ncbi:MAG TPA: hypothetical protein VK730_13765 [Solirubrobacteraceae bacterium]|jgi:hypothetical protein|nr:hypothetical protein [Solirubrobacteraceae bacterium]
MTGAPYAIRLSTIGSRDMEVRVEDSALAEANVGGKTVWFDFHGKLLAVTFTRGEAAWLARQLEHSEMA